MKRNWEKTEKCFYTTVEEENETLLNNVLEPEDRCGSSTESQVDNNEKQRKSKNRKKTAPKSTMKVIVWYITGHHTSK